MKKMLIVLSTFVVMMMFMAGCATTTTVQTYVSHEDGSKEWVSGFTMDDNGNIIDRLEEES